MKTCADCKEFLPFDRFHRKGAKVDGSPKYSSRCDVCKNKYQREYHAVQSNGDKQRARVNKSRPNQKRHGMTLAQREELKESQGYRCAICKEGYCEVIDHDHSCCPGRQGCIDCVRGYLCKNCNWLLGDAKDDVSILYKAIAYLEKK